MGIKDSNSFIFSSEEYYFRSLQTPYDTILAAMANGRANSRSGKGRSPPRHTLSAELVSSELCTATATAMEAGITSPPQHDAVADMIAYSGISNDEFKDLGDALASMFASTAAASGSQQQQQPSPRAGSPRGSNESSITSLSIASSSSFEDLLPVAEEKVAVALGDGGAEVADSATSPAAPPSSDSEEEPIQDDKKTNKVIKLPQSK